jgi:hypothetical protein
MLGEFYDTLRSLPALYSKDRRWRGRPLKEVVEASKEETVRRLVMKTVKRHFSALGGIFPLSTRAGRGAAHRERAMQVKKERGSVLILDKGATIEVRDWFPECDYSGHLADGETHREHDGCTWPRQGAPVVIIEPARVAAQERSRTTSSALE